MLNCASTHLIFFSHHKHRVLILKMNKKIKNELLFLATVFLYYQHCPMLALTSKEVRSLVNVITMFFYFSSKKEVAEVAPYVLFLSFGYNLFEKHVFEMLFFFLQL